jgi:hypothetical protein
MTVLDRVDLVFIPGEVILVHTSTSNAGIFTSSDVFELPRRPGVGVDRAPLEGDRERSRLLELGLPFYHSRTGACA